MREMEGFDGVEIVYPYEVNDPAATRAVLKKHKLKVAAVNVNVKGEPEFRNGGLTSLDRKVRNKAVRFIKEAKDFAEAIGANKVTCCPLGDGYEFVFQHDYATAWKHLIETFGAAGSYKTNIPLFIEYKPSETRGRCFLDTAAKTLCLLNDLKIKELGVTLDFGHSTYANESPAEAMALLAESAYPYYVHINDNDGRWDWDMLPGAFHLWEFVELFYTLRKLGYDNDWYAFDVYPKELDTIQNFTAAMQLTRKLEAITDRIDVPTMEGLLRERNSAKTLPYLYSLL